MINYFFFPDSYKEMDISLIKNSIEDLNKAILKKDKNETFYENSSFYTIEYTVGHTLYETLSNSHKDLTNRIIPSMLRRMKHITTISSDISNYNTIYSDAWANCLWGWFAVENKNHICSYNFFCSNRKLIAKGIINGMNFDDVSSLLIETVRVTDNALEQIRHLGGRDNFKKVLDSICSLDNYNTDSWSYGGFQLRILQQHYNVNISDESDSVKSKNQLKQQRYFKISDKLGSQYCYFHVKLGDIRMHIFPDENERVIYVAYVGAHLDL